MGQMASLAETIKAMVEDLGTGEKLHVVSHKHRAAQVTACLSLAGLWMFERAEDTPTGCIVVARRIRPLNPGKPAKCGAAML